MPRNKIRRYLKHGTLPQISVFEAVARLGSFTKAAEELYMAQPTVSVQMKKLSETVGLPLVEQIGKRVHLTEAGRAVHAASNNLFATLVELETQLANIRGMNTGRLQLAVSTTGKYFAPRVLAEFVKQHPGVEVSLQIHNRATLLERMAQNLDDLYIFANPPGESDVVTQTILPNPMVPYGPADHPLAKEKNIPFARFAEEPFLIREAGSGTRMIAREIFAEHDIEPKVRMELSTNEAIKQAIIAGLGVSIMSRYTLGLDVTQEQLAVLDVEGFPVEKNWVFAYPVGKQLPMLAQGFMDFTRKVARPLVYDHLSKS
jgi:DNA-binding transcriptional LysR family regulator